MDSQAPNPLPQHQTAIDLGGLMAVLSQHLYSTPDVAIRELVQNAHDSVIRRRHLALDGRAELSTEQPRITVIPDVDNSIIEVADNGSGLTEEEIHTLLATVGIGATRQLREHSKDDDLIGMFGLGFLSSFVIAERVNLVTTSATAPHLTHEYSSTDGHKFTVKQVENRPVGSTVTVRLKTSFGDLAEPLIIAGLLNRYCRLLAVPIYIDGNTEPINLSVPWRNSSATRHEQMDFARHFDSRFTPLAAIPVGTFGDDLVGQLWIHDGSTYGNADNRQMSVFVRGMLLAENDADLLPRWAGFISGAIESPTLTPTASRESLQKDKAYSAAVDKINEDLVTGLANLALHDPPTWRRVLSRHNHALLGAAITDDRLFELTAAEITLPTSHGHRTLSQLEHDGRIHVALSSDSGFEELLFSAQGIPVARGDLYGVLPFVQKYANDRGLESVEIGTSEGNALLFRPARLDLDELAFLERELAEDDEAIAPVEFEPQTIPLVVVPDRDAELKKRIEQDDIDSRAGAGVASLARIHTRSIESRADIQVFVNTACPTVQRLLRAREVNPVGASRAAALLRTLKTMMASMDATRTDRVDLSKAFGDALLVLDGLLLTAANSETNDP